MASKTLIALITALTGVGLVFTTALAETTPAAAETEGTVPKRGPAADNADPKIVKMYESIFYNNYKGTFRRGDRKAVNALGDFAEQQRILKESGPPDTYWITGWDGVAAGHRELAVIQAGINRTWLKDCHADFEKYEAKYAKARAQLDEDFAFVRAESTGFYAGAERLRAMWKRGDEIFKAENLWLPRAHVLNKGYLWGELVALEYELIARTGRSGLSRFIAPQWARENARVNPASAQARRMVYCWGASTTGTPSHPFLSQAADYRHTKGKPFIRHVYSKEEGKQVEAWREKAKPAPKAEPVMPAVLHVTSLPAKTKAGTPTFVGYSGSPFMPVLEVAKIKRNGKSAKVTLKWERPGTQKYDCKTTNELQRIDSDGTLLYRVDCKTRPTKFKIEAVVSFDELPEGVQVGDTLGAYGRVTRYSMKQTKTKTNIKVSVDAVHLRDVNRGGQSVLSF